MPDRYVHRDVLPAEILGTWQISPQTIQTFQQEDGENSLFLKNPQHITFLENGSCVVEIFPFIPSLPSKTSVYRDDYIDASYICSWKMTTGRTYIDHRQADVQIVEITATNERNDSGIQQVDSCTIKLFIAEENGELILWDFIGDPDYCNYRDFKKSDNFHKKTGPAALTQKSDNNKIENETPLNANSDQENAMLKLYKFTDSEKLYWETWDNGDGTHTVHWGQLGTQGQSKTIRSSFFKKASDIIQKETDKIISEGYCSIDLDDCYILLIEYEIDGMGNAEDIEKRYRLEDRMNETLGWTGLGICDGGSIGSGTMEVCNYVIDFELAKKVIEDDLKHTEFANYTRIYDENE